MSRTASLTGTLYPLQSPPPPGSPDVPTSPTFAEKPPRVPREIRALKNGKVPPPKGRTIIVCLDGTGDKFDGDNSNIVHLVSCLKKSDPTQVTYYQSGIGTYDGKGLSKGFHAGVDMAVGSGLGVHIRDAYRFLMQTYKEHDRICLFGFSRGAYTARCLAGMIHKVGLLPARNVSQIPFAYQYYKTDTPEGWKMSAEFKRTFCMNVSVHFIGVFDSVASVGFIPRRLPLSSTPKNKAVYFRHAMALDEHRAKFKVCRFQTKNHTDAGSQWEVVAQIHEDAVIPKRRSTNPTPGRLGHKRRTASIISASTDKDEKKSLEDTQPLKEELTATTPETDVLEVWFTGCHADVGGGAVKNEERHKLSQIPLRWMIRQCFECDTGIIFKTHRLAEEGIDVHSLYPLYTALERPKVGPAPSMLDKYHAGEIAPISRRATVLQPVDEENPHGLHEVKLFADTINQAMLEHWVPEQVEDYFDCISPINDQLVQAKGWWILEFWPIKVRVLAKETDAWVKKIAMNLGRYRPVLEESPNLHWTVQQRAEAMGYAAKVRLGRKANWHVVV